MAHRKNGFVYHVLAPFLKIYVNGREIKKDVLYNLQSASQTANSNLFFGGASSSTNEYWGMHIDDFAVWKGHLLTNDEIVYIMNKGILYILK